MITPGFSLTATERVLPKLALDFTTAVLDPRVTFTRALNTATVTNSNGYVVPINADLPRFDYDPITLACKGLLIEEARTNLITYSQDYTNVSWQKQNVTIIANSTASPAGTTTATTLTASAGSNFHVINPVTYLGIPFGTYTVSQYVKAGTSNFVSIGAFNNSVSYIAITANLSTVAITQTIAGGAFSSISSSITAVSNGFYRIVATFSTTSALTSGFLTTTQINSSATPTIGSFGVETWTAAGTESIYIWGAQLEAAAFPTSYIPTTTAALTRNADVATMTGTNFSSWYTGGTSGTMVVQATPPNASQSFAAVLAFAGASPSTDFIYLGRSGTSARAFDNVAGVGQGTFNFGTWANGTAGKTSIAYAPSNVAPCFNAGTVTVNNTANVPTLVKAYIGNFSDGGSTVWNGIVSKIFYFPQRLTNAEIQAFTK